MEIYELYIAHIYVLLREKYCAVINGGTNDFLLDNNLVVGSPRDKQTRGKQTSVTGKQRTVHGVGQCLKVSTHKSATSV